VSSTNFSVSCDCEIFDFRRVTAKLHLELAPSSFEALSFLVLALVGEVDREFEIQDFRLRFVRDLDGDRSGGL